MGLHTLQVRLVKQLGEYRWQMVESCPKCWGRHSLPAGFIDKDDPDKYLGNRTLPCGMVAHLVKKD